MSKRWLFILVAWVLLFSLSGGGLYAYSLDPDCVPNSECDRTKVSLPAKVLTWEAIIFVVVTSAIAALGSRDKRKRLRR